MVSSTSRRESMVTPSGKSKKLEISLRRNEVQNASNKHRTTSLNSSRRFSEQDAKFARHYHLENIDSLSKNELVMKIFNKLKAKIVTQFLKNFSKEFKIKSKLKVFAKGLKRVFNLRLEKVLLNTIKAFVPYQPIHSSMLEELSTTSMLRRSLLVDLQPCLKSSNHSIHWRNLAMNQIPRPWSSLCDNSTMDTPKRYLNLRGLRRSQKQKVLENTA